jgi:hypothetical protein
LTDSIAKNAELCNIVEIHSIEEPVIPKKTGTTQCTEVGLVQLESETKLGKTQEVPSCAHQEKPARNSPQRTA